MLVLIVMLKEIRCIIIIWCFVIMFLMDGFYVVFVVKFNW